jgi:hypothetical protein
VRATWLKERQDEVMDGFWVEPQNQGRARTTGSRQSDRCSTGSKPCKFDRCSTGSKPCKFPLCVLVSFGSEGCLLVPSISSTQVATWS